METEVFISYSRWCAGPHQLPAEAVSQGVRMKEFTNAGTFTRVPSKPAPRMARLPGGSYPNRV